MPVYYQTDYYQTTGGAATNANVTFYATASNCVTTGGNANQLAYFCWPTDGTQTVSVSYQTAGAGDWYWPMMETEEQRQTRETREAIERQKRDAAAKRSEALLLMCLNDAQKRQYAELGYFETQVNDKIYRINKGRSGNVQLIEKGAALAKFCIHPQEFIPDADTMLAQFLMLTTDESQFLRTANRTRLM